MWAFVGNAYVSGREKDFFPIHGQLMCNNLAMCYILSGDYSSLKGRPIVNSTNFLLEQIVQEHTV